MAEGQREKESIEVQGHQYVRVEVIARLFGMDVRRVQQLTQDGTIETTKIPGAGRRYDLIPTIQAYITFLRNKAYGRSKSEKEAELKEQKLEAEIALKESQNEIHKMRRDIAAGKYIDVEEVTLDYQKFFVAFKRFAMGIPARLVGMISDQIPPMEARRIEKELNGEMKRMLLNFVVAGVRPEDLKKSRKPKSAGSGEANDHAEEAADPEI